MRKKSLIFACFFIVFDQIIKLFINNSFSYGQMQIVIPNFFHITKIYNYGAAWSMFSGGRYLLIMIAIASFGLLYSYQVSFRYKERTVLGFSLVYGGLFGNLIDRLFWGYVIDYIELNFGNYHFPIFNFADMCLIGGFILIIYALFKGEDKYAVKGFQRKNKTR